MPRQGADVQRRVIATLCRVMTGRAGWYFTLFLTG